MKFSVWPNPERSPATVLDIARAADSAGFFGFWFADHYMPNSGSEDFVPGDVHECWAMLPAVAAVTRSIRIGPLVAPTSVHHPAVLANRASSIDHLSQGRMVLGVGAGWQINEHKAYGLDLEPPGTRVSRFEEAIQVMRTLLNEERTDFHGDFYDITDAPSDPKPVQSPLPLLVGTASPRMLRITARHADEWNAWGAPDLAAQSHTKFLAACEAVGRDPASMHRSSQALVFLSDDDTLAENVAKGPMAERSIVGGPAKLVDEIAKYAEIGFDEFIVPDFTFGSEAGQIIETLERFDAEVASHLR